jgi:hypothetical protein
MAMMGYEDISLSVALWIWASIGGAGLGAVLVEALTGPGRVRPIRMPRLRWARLSRPGTAALKAEPVPC